MKRGTVVANIVRIVAFGVFAILLMVVAKSLEGTKSNKSAEEKSVAQAFQSASNEVVRILGEKPLNVDIMFIDTGEVLNLNDENAYKALFQMMGYMSSPYKEEMRKFLSQTKLTTDNPSRDKFIFVFASDSDINTSLDQKTPKNDQDVHAAMRGTDGCKRMHLWVNQNELAHWIRSPGTDFYIIAKLIHEFKHYLDFLHRYDELYAPWQKKIEYVNANLEGFTFSSKEDWDMFFLAMQAQLVIEMRGFEAMFHWIDTNPYGNVDLPGPYQTMRIALKQNDGETYIKVLYGVYRDDVWERVSPQEDEIEMCDMRVMIGALNLYNDLK